MWVTNTLWNYLPFLIRLSFRYSSFYHCWEEPFANHHFAIVERNFFQTYVFETYQACYIILLICQFLFIIILKHIFCLPKKPQYFFFQMARSKSLFKNFQCLKNHTMLSYNCLSVFCIQLFLYLHFSTDSGYRFFQGPGFRGSGSTAGSKF